MKRDLLSENDLSVKEVKYILDLTAKLKKNKKLSTNLLKDKTIALVFQKPSNRTRVSFQVGVFQLGGTIIYLSPSEINLGVRESTHDIAKTLSRYVDGVVARTNSHKDVVDLAKYASVPIINGLSDLYHPCQGLTDVFSIQEYFGKCKGLTLAYVGDGNNVCHSLLLSCAKVGIHVRVATPKGYEPSRDVVALADKYGKETGSVISLTTSPEKAVTGAHVLYSDVWVSMGQEEETKKRIKDFEGFQFNAKLAKLADKNYIFMHCLPAHRGLEVTEDIIDGKHSIVFDQAENRLHTQKAILQFLYK
jgi:ornithine carbamoyltransferase